MTGKAHTKDWKYLTNKLKISNKDVRLNHEINSEEFSLIRGLNISPNTNVKSESHLTLVHIRIEEISVVSPRGLCLSVNVLFTLLLFVEERRKDSYFLQKPKSVLGRRRLTSGVRSWVQYLFTVEIVVVFGDTLWNSKVVISSLGQFMLGLDEVITRTINIPLRILNDRETWDISDTTSSFPKNKGSLQSKIQVQTNKQNL